MAVEMPFADCDDVAARWREMDSAERARCAVLLGDASLMLANLVQARGARLDEEEPGGMLARTLEMVACSMVVRAMKAPADMAALTSYSQGAGSYTEQMTYANPNGDLYVTAAEKRQLGVGGARIGSIPAMIGPRDD